MRKHGRQSECRKVQLNQEDNSVYVPLFDGQMRERKAEALWRSPGVQHCEISVKTKSNIDKPFLLDRSGVMLAMSAERSGALEVMFVADGTPAYQAGLLRGDVILAIDAVPTGEIRLNDARVMFCRSERYLLDVERDGRAFETTIETRPLFSD